MIQRRDYQIPFFGIRLEPEPEPDSVMYNNILNFCHNVATTYKYKYVRHYKSLHTQIHTTQVVLIHFYSSK